MLGVIIAAVIVGLLMEHAKNSKMEQTPSDTKINNELLGGRVPLAEMVRTGSGIPNNPTAFEIANLDRLVRTTLNPLMEGLRSIYGQHVTCDITSGFRCDAVNKAVGGSSNSHHLRGNAADLRFNGVTSQQVASYIYTSAIPFTEAIYYAPSRGGHVHVAFNGDNTHKAMYAPAEGGYRNISPPLVAGSIIAKPKGTA